MTRDDPGFLVVTGSVSSQLQNLSSQILQNGCQVDRGAGTNTLSVVALPQQPVNTSDWKLQPSAGGAALRLGPSFSAFSSS